MVIPIAFQSLMTSAVSASDAVMLGFLNQHALSAVSLAGQITFVLNLFITVLTQGTTLLAAQYWGTENRKVVEMVIALAIKCSLCITAIFMIGAVFFSGQLMRIFTNDPLLIGYGIEYLQIVGFSYILTGFSQMYLCIMKNTGKTAKSTVIGSSAMVLNLLLNTVLIFGFLGFPALGIKGAAISTVIATLTQTVWVLIESKKLNSIKIRLVYLIRIDTALQKDFAKYTMPIVGNYMFWGCGVTMYSVIMGHLGSDAIAANSIANIVRNLITCVSKGIGTAGAILVGYELGKNKIKIAILYAKRSTIFSAACGVCSGLVILMIRPAILNFSGFSPVASTYLSGMLLICAYYVVPGAINNTVIGGIFCAGGKSKFGLICDAIVIWLVIIPLSCLAAFYWQFPVTAVYAILCLDECVKVPIVFWYFRRYSWTQNITRQIVAADVSKEKKQ
jgi:putative MATE family efflux protein